MLSFEACGGIFILWIATFGSIRAITGSTNACDSMSFKCQDGSCITLQAYCDDIQDCADGSDELYCDYDSNGQHLTIFCPEYECRNGNCYSIGDVCDGIEDCMDGSDERDCARRRCEEWEFKCANHRCIHVEFFCDGNDDCNDGSDERNCTQCFNEAFTCNGGGCVKDFKVCDNTTDCLDGSDEAYCTNKGCNWKQFACNDGQCVSLTYRCDGDTDCGDGSDEIKCTIACDSTAFKCQDGSCIKQEAVCNHNEDCSDGRDELNCSEKWNPETFQRMWQGKHQLLRSKYMDDHVVFYIDSEVDPSITLPIEPISEAWKHVKETYGSFGSNPRLYILLRSASFKETHTAPFWKQFYGYRNIIVHGLQSPTPLTVKHSSVFHVLITAFGNVIREAAKEILNNADEDICAFEMREILSYDAYKCINNPSEEMENWVASKLKQSVKGIYWFRNWFLPIYEAYGEASVLERFYNLTYNYFRRPTDTMEYSNKLNKGEFVHFWSGAAGTDLQYLAQQALYCSDLCVQELLIARKDYPFFNYTVNNRKLVFADKHIAIHLQTFRLYRSSFYRKISNMWQYIKSHYGPFYHQLTPTIVLNNKTHSDYSCKPLQESQQSKRDAVLYVIVCNSTETLKNSEYLDEIAEYIGTMAINRRGKPENWWPGFGVSGWTMISIIVYDIYNCLESTRDSKRWLGHKIKESSPFPRAKTLWFQNWYLQIYNVHGESQALIRFLNLLDANWTSNHSLNTGEFVHFWSGATETNLQILAKDLMGWNFTYQKQLDDARNILPFNYTCKFNLTFSL